ncbi:hypothetical protein KR767_16815 [Luteibacter anthropi]|uniref:COG4280 domain-containing protein n=1 Tax=Luteibacter anthropi TaxID=564369 RepID=UPI002032A8FA|nr:hypothetical protein [Luteibacter anthropi]URX61705.1 hypothetical protein KR767_16815 [Luteibacter anthropi]
MSAWTTTAPTTIAAFLASLVEFVEALTIVLAVGVVRGWRDALAGVAAAMLILGLAVLFFGPAMARIPLGVVQLLVGALLLLFGMRWLRKAMLRAAGVIALHDETAAFEAEQAQLIALGQRSTAFDKVAFMTAMKITLLEGIEVVFIVIALGAAGRDRLWSASVGAVAALLLVIALGALVHRPLARVPENTLKFTVGVLLTAFGTFWVGEGRGIVWPGGDLSVLGLILLYAVAASAGVIACRRELSSRAGIPS